MNVFVYLATTQGPSLVQRIIPEDADVQSLVCENFGYDPLPISNGYYNFVKKGPGLIHKDFGHGAFRVDVDKAITQGKSWQLGMYLAHYAQSQNVLLTSDGSVSSQPEAGDIVVWATGEVKADRQILSVKQVAKKLILSEPLFEHCLSHKIRVLTFIPASDAEELKDVGFANTDIRLEHLNVKSLGDVDSALNELKRYLPDQHAAAAATESDESEKARADVEDRESLQNNKASIENREGHGMDKKPDDLNQTDGNARKKKSSPVGKFVITGLVLVALVFGATQWLGKNSGLPKGAKPDVTAIDDFGGKPADSLDPKTIDQVSDKIQAVAKDGITMVKSLKDDVGQAVNDLTASFFSEGYERRHDLQLEFFTLDREGNCASKGSVLTANNFSFENLPLDKLCGLEILNRSLAEHEKVFIMSPQFEGIIPVRLAGGNWSVMSPSNRDTDKTLWIVISQHESRFLVEEKLSAFLAEQKPTADKPLRKSELVDWLNKKEVPAAIYTLVLEK